MSFSVGIVGGSGLIARSIWQTYSTRTDTRVHLFARSRSEGLRDDVEYTQIDLIKDQSLPAAIFNCDLMINASSCVDGDAHAMRRVNIEGVRRLANAVKSERGKFLHIGTAGVYGTLMRSGGIEGGYEVRPESELSQSRAEGEMVAVSAGATVVRPLFVTGAGDRHFLLPLLRAHLLLDAWIEEGIGDSTRERICAERQLALSSTVTPSTVR